MSYGIDISAIYEIYVGSANSLAEHTFYLRTRK